jgi:hypothetical protein
MTLKIGTTARKLKVTLVLEAGPLAALRIPDGAPSRTELTVMVGGRAVVADLATKAVRKVVKALADHGTDGVVVLLQGVLEVGDRVGDAGISATVKAPAEAQKTAATG